MRCTHFDPDPDAKILAVALAATLAGGVIYQTLTVRRQHAELSAAHDRFGRSSADLVKLQRTTEAARRRALTLQSELARIGPTKPDADPTMAAEIAAWLARVEKLKDLFTQHSTAATPEMSLPIEKDWFDAARDADFTTDETTRKSLAGLRDRAKSKLVEPLKKALVQ
ncbi:MAG: hypothetical protein H7343_18440 [Undibacterium sp.]|nr:hypothetical protein [Opitutaceae bacterium]